MGSHGGRFATDVAAFNGAGFPSILELELDGTLVSYVSGRNGFFVPPSFGANRQGAAIALADVQFWYGIAGAGATTLADNYLLQLIDTSVDLAGAGTVSSTGAAVTGTSTVFLTLFAVGDTIRSGTNSFKITAIADDTHLTLEVAPAVDWSSAAYFRVPKIRTLATITQARNLKFSAPQDLRVNGVGVPILPGQGIRIDTGAIGLTYSPAPSDIKVRFGIEAYSIEC